MRKILFLLLIIPTLVFSQKKDYNSYDKAVSYFNKGEVEKAKKNIEKCIQKNVDWEKPYQLLGKIYEEEGNIESAVENYYLGFEHKNPTDQLWWKKIGELYFENGMYPDAMYHFKKFVAFQSKEAAFYKKAIKHIQDCMFAISAMQNPVAFSPKNMGENINSEMAEYLPFISADGKQFVITRKVKDEIDLQEDFFYSQKDESNNWQKVKKMSSINSPFNEGAISISADGRFLIFTACNRADSKGSCDLYFQLSEKEKAFNLEIINSKSWDTQGCFSPDGKYLYFVSNRPGGYGAKDIWISEIGENGFGKPFNAGPIINTEYNEMSPFLHADNLTLYFASDGHIGLGGFDLFVSRRMDVSQDWDTPENIGYPINTHKVENSLIVGTNGKTAYYASDKDGYGLEDIFWFDLPKEKQANEILDLELEIITQKQGEEVILRNVQFSHNSFTLNENSFIELNSLITYLKKNPQIKIQIEGYTDNMGEEKENQILSENRAIAVYNYLTQNNITENRLSYKGFGEQKPLAPNETEKGRKMNRRTSFKIIQ
jgi:outer membrane protein OmpA-like peptidoglycan-associated protein